MSTKPGPFYKHGSQPRSFSEVRQAIGGLKGVMRAMGDAPPNEKWSRFPHCPFCGRKGSGVFILDEGVDMFKCHHTSCSSGGVAMTEVGYIACRKGLSTARPVGGGASPAYEYLLRLSGMWEEGA